MKDSVGTVAKASMGVITRLESENRALRARIAELEAAQGARVPEGYVLVPKESTEAMIGALLDLAMDDDEPTKLKKDHRHLIAKWTARLAAMYAASPSAPSREKMTVTDDMVERASTAYLESVKEFYGRGVHTVVDLDEVRSKSMRAALRAALAKEGTP